MSLSKECGVCPFNRGFDVEPGYVLTTCGDPSQRCINLREKLVDQLASWNRYMSLARSAGSGILALEFIQPEDYVEIISSIAGKPYRDNTNRRFRLKAIDSDGSGLFGEVIKDSYNDTDDEEEREFAVPKGDKVEIHGAFDRQSTDWHGIELPGEIHVGRHVYYTPEGASGSRRGLYVQEVTLMNSEHDLAINIFGTDPKSHRAAPSLST